MPVKPPQSGLASLCQRLHKCVAFVAVEQIRHVLHLAIQLLKNHFHPMRDALLDQSSDRGFACFRRFAPPLLDLRSFFKVKRKVNNWIVQGQG